MNGDAGGRSGPEGGHGGPASATVAPRASRIGLLLVALLAAPVGAAAQCPDASDEATGIIDFLLSSDFREDTRVKFGLPTMEAGATPVVSGVENAQVCAQLRKHAADEGLLRGGGQVTFYTAGDFYFVVLWYPETGDANTRVRIGGGWKPVHVIRKEGLHLVARLML